MIHRTSEIPLLDAGIAAQAAGAALRKLDPRELVRNPVMFVTAVTAVLTTVLFVRDLVTGVPSTGSTPAVVGQIAAWLWFTVLFANFAEAIAEGRGKAQAASLRRTKTETPARKVSSTDGDRRAGGSGIQPPRQRPRAGRSGRGDPRRRRCGRRHRHGR